MKRLLIAVLLSCGAPYEPPSAEARAAFVGSWRGQYVIAVTENGKTDQAQASTQWFISRSDLSVDRVTWNTQACTYQARVTTDTSFVIDPVNCSTVATDAGCTLSLSVKQGSGTRSGTSLSVTVGGDTLYQCGSRPQPGTFTMRFDGSS